MRDAAILELLEDELERRHLLLVGLAHHDRRIAGGQRTSRIGLEFDGAGAVEKGEAVAEKIDRSHVELNAHAVMPCLVRGVADRVLGTDRALPADDAGAGENGFEKGCFSA